MILSTSELKRNYFQILSLTEIIKNAEHKLKYTRKRYYPGKGKMRPSATGRDHESLGLRLTVCKSYANFLLLIKIIPASLMRERGRNGGERRKVYSLV
jgi:hypothetical protein